MPVRPSVRDARFSIRDISETADGMDDVVRLDIGQPDVDAPDAVLEAVREAADDHVTYTSLWGMRELREELAEYESWKADFSYENVMVSTGGIGALSCILATLLDHGDEVLMNDPAWSPYSLIAKVSPGTSRQVPFVRDGSIDVDGMRDAITDDTELLLINSPENPTGRVYSREEFEAVADLAAEHDLTIISDEVYDHILYDDADHVSMAAVAPDRTIVVNSSSKNFAMTGYRVGWLASMDRDLVHEIGKANRAMTACPNYLGQKALLAALRHGRDATEEMVATFQERKDATMDHVRALGWDCIAPRGAIYAFPDTGRDSWPFAHALLEEAGVAVVPGEPHGTHSSTNIRVCFGSADIDAIHKGFERIRRFVDA